MPAQSISTSTVADGSDDPQFITASHTAMVALECAIESTAPPGDVDRDFVALMIPHHQAAIEMAQTELRDGHNERLRRMAQEIIVTQTQEIEAMRLAIGQPIASTPTPASPVPGMS
jgi:uncharacterized protein (DUF305 family)